MNLSVIQRFLFGTAISIAGVFVTITVETDVDVYDLSWPDHLLITDVLTYAGQPLAKLHTTYFTVHRTSTVWTLYSDDSDIERLKGSNTNFLSVTQSSPKKGKRNGLRFIDLKLRTTIFHTKWWKHNVLKLLNRPASCRGIKLLLKFVAKDTWI